MDWPAFVAASGGAIVAATGLVALLAKLAERRGVRREHQIRRSAFHRAARARRAQRRRARTAHQQRDVTDLWRILDEISCRVRALEAGDVIERHDRPISVRGRRR